MPPPVIIAKLMHYPVKGLRGLAKSQAALTAGEGMPLDRVYAIENGSHRFDAQNPKWFPKTHFLQLMRNERLASLALTFDEASHILTLFRDGRQVAKGALKTKLGRQIIEQFLASYMKTDLNGPPRIVCAEGQSFTDIAEKALHLVNLETVRDVSRVLGIDLDPLRFRANVYFDGLPAWQERHWLGKTIVCGKAHLKVFDETGRCEATSVDPNTAQRGLSVPSALLRTWGHSKLGLYAKVIHSGVISTGDTASVS
ncbi:MAG TPA: MOSC domain-containing protein [Rhodomicrobium sp.]|nr:MOSC domain-containing protein [Rhodomicrobium sp.]